MTERFKSLSDFFVAIIGYVCAHIDLILARSIAVLSLTILAIRLYRLIFKKTSTKQTEEEEI
jgi:hypothetical protein